MASVQVEATIAVAPAVAWELLRDWHHLERLAPGFVTGVEADGEDRIVTFFTGTTLREVLVDCDDQRQRLSWSIVDPPYAHHNGVVQLLSDAAGATRFVWTADLLPHALGERTQAMMTAGLDAIRQSLERLGDGGARPRAR